MMSESKIEYSPRYLLSWTFFGMQWMNFGGLRLVPTAANGQPAFGMYERAGADAPWAAHSIHVLALEHDLISTITTFVEPALFHSFGLPLILPDTASAESPSTPHHS